jgi:hypothetical protein
MKNPGDNNPIITRDIEDQVIPYRVEAQTRREVIPLLPRVGMSRQQRTNLLDPIE